MRARSYTAILLVLAVAGLWQVASQRRAIAELREQLSSKTHSAHLINEPLATAAADGTKSASPSPEVLRLRSEVTMLMKEVEKAVAPTLASKDEAEKDWALVHSGAKPSQLPGFVYITNTVPAGFAVPESAFQTWHYAMRNQHKEPLKSQPPMDIWDVPDDFYDPNARYSLDIGEGIGGEIGYRIVSQEMISPNEVRLIVDFEKEDGSSFRREKVLVHRNGKWRMKPVSVRRQE